MPTRKTKTVATPAQVTGTAGVFYVAGELSIRGLIALPTVRNTAGADIMVSNLTGTRTAFLQVNTVQDARTDWLPGKKGLEWCGPDYFYVFVTRVRGRFEAYMEKADVVAEEMRDKVKRLAGDNQHHFGCYAWGLHGRYATQDAEQRTRALWETFTL